MTGKDDSLAAASEDSGTGAEWRLPKPVVNLSSGSSEWAPAKPDVSWTPPTAKEAARHAVLQMQCRVFESFGKFLARTARSDDDEAAEEDDNVAEDGGLEESEEYKFTLDLFVRDMELRGYYETNYVSGDFYCFVCGGDKEFGKKKFESCEGLLQHSFSTANENLKQAHRALGLVICKVLGWDFDRLPMVVAKGEPLGRSLASFGDIKGRSKYVGVEKDAAIAAHSGELQSDLEESIASKCFKNLDQGNEDMGVVKGESSDKVDAMPRGCEWPCQKVTVSSNSALREWLSLPSDSSSLPVSAEEVAKLAAEQKVLEACQDFFHRKYGSGSEADEDDFCVMDEDENDEEEEDGCEDGESKESEFFIKLFMEDAKLRTYYEKCHGDGDFLCLVCAGVGKKTWRRFKGCIGLLHHSNTIWKTKKKAHRAYARTVCKVLGWDINQLPKIVHISEPLSSFRVDSATMLGSVPPNSSSAKWPCEDIKNVSDLRTSEWPNLRLRSVNDSASAEEKVKVASDQKILTACRDFFKCKYGSIYDGDENEDKCDLMDEEEVEGDEEDEDEDGFINGESEELKFFVKLFEENTSLRSYYEKSSGGGDFLCLVCAAVKKKTWRRFKGCSGLLHHANSIWKVEKKAHRAYAKAVSKVLGRDIERLPRIVNISEPLGQPLAGTQDSVPLPGSEAEWPCGDMIGSKSSKSEWPSLKLPSESVSAVEQEKLAAEQKVLRACQNFFCNKCRSELNEDDDDEGSNNLTDEDDEAQDMEKEEETVGGDHYGNNEEFKFFTKLFNEDEKLRSFYVNNRGSGDFRCLVCAAVHKKDWKRFKGCVGLLNHSNMVLKTKRKAHRAYARAVCGILGWAVEQSWRVATVAEPLGGSLATSEGMQDEAKANADVGTHPFGEF